MGMKKIGKIAAIFVAAAITAATIRLTAEGGGKALGEQENQEDKNSIFSKSNIKRTNEAVMAEIEPRVKKSLLPSFQEAGVELGSGKITMVVLKEEKILELWAEKKGKWTFIKDYKILAASGTAGPKLKEGDKQVPEGVYNITAMNPDSKYHLAMLVGYPNEFDRARAKEEGRDKLGGDICIHGKSASAGCIAVGDPASEELYYLTYKLGMKNAKVIIAPYDFRKGEKNIAPENTEAKWVENLYGMIRDGLKEFKRD